MTSPGKLMGTQELESKSPVYMHMDIKEEAPRDEEGFLVKLLFGSLLSDEDENINVQSPPSVSTSFNTRYNGSRKIQSGGSTPSFLTPTVKHKEIKLDGAPSGSQTLPCMDWLHKQHSQQSFQVFRTVPSYFSLEAEKGGILLHNSVLGTIYDKVDIEQVPQVHLPKFSEYFINHDVELQKFVDSVGCYFLASEHDSITASQTDVTQDNVCDSGLDSIVKGDVTSILKKPLDMTCIRLDQQIQLNTMRHCKLTTSFLPDLHSIVDFLPAGVPIDREASSILCTFDQRVYTDSKCTSCIARDVYTTPISLDTSPQYRFMQGIQLQTDKVTMTNQTQQDKYQNASNNQKHCSNQEIRILLDQLVYEARIMEQYCVSCYNHCRMYSEKVYKQTYQTSTTCYSSAQPVLASGFNLIGMLQSHLTYLYSVLWFIQLYSTRYRQDQLQEVREQGDRRVLARLCDTGLSGVLVKQWKKAYEFCNIKSISALYASAIHLSYVLERLEFGSILHTMSQVPQIENTEQGLLSYIREVRHAAYIPKQMLQPSSLYDILIWLVSIPRDIVLVSDCSVKITQCNYLPSIWQQLLYSQRSKAGRHYLYARHLWSEVQAGTLEAVAKSDDTRLDLMRGQYIKNDYPQLDALFLLLESSEVRQVTLQIVKQLPKVQNKRLHEWISGVVMRDFLDIAILPTRVLAESARECVDQLHRQQATLSQVVTYLNSCSVILRLAMKQKLLRTFHPHKLGLPLNLFPLSFLLEIDDMNTITYLDALQATCKLPAAYTEVIHTLNQLTTIYIPIDILKILMAAAEQLTNVAVVHLNANAAKHQKYTKEDVSGDDFMNLWVYVWIHVENIYEIIPRIEITKHFTPTMGQESYILTSTQIALKYIEKYNTFEEEDCK